MPHSQKHQTSPSKSLNGGLSNGFTFSLDTPSMSSGTLDKYLQNVLGENSMTSIPDLLKHGTSAQLSNNKAESQYSATPSSETSAPAQTTSETDISSDPSDEKNNVIVTNVVPATPSEGTNSREEMPTNGDMVPNTLTDIIPMPKGQAYVDITEYLNMPQADAARKLGIPPSTLSKRWKEAVRKRKWPYRMICKIDKEIMTLLHNVPQGPNAPPLPEEIETALGQLLKKRQEELRSVVIRI